MPDETQTPEQHFDQNDQQIADLTEVIKAFRTGDFATMDALYCALRGGGAEKLDYTPTFPKA